MDMRWHSWNYSWGFAILSCWPSHSVCAGPPRYQVTVKHSKIQSVLDLFYLVIVLLIRRHSDWPVEHEPTAAYK